VYAEMVLFFYDSKAGIDTLPFEKRLLVPQRGRDTEGFIFNVTTKE
jgi:hypothetical protein